MVNCDHTVTTGEKKRMIDEFIATAESFQKTLHDHETGTTQIKFSNLAHLILPETLFGRIPHMVPTPWAWGQIYDKLAPSESAFGKNTNRSLPKEYFNAIPGDLKSEIL